MKALDQNKEVERITDKLFDLNSWIEASFPSDKREDFFKELHLKEVIFWKQYQSLKMNVSTIWKIVELLNIPPQLIEPLFFNKKPKNEIKEQLKTLVELSIENERKE